jgi:hypothetical protein
MRAGLGPYPLRRDRVFVLFTERCQLVERRCTTGTRRFDAPSLAEPAGISHAKNRIFSEPSHPKKIFAVTSPFLRTNV